MPQDKSANRGVGERESNKDGLKPEHAGAPKEIPGGAGRENVQGQGTAAKGKQKQGKSQRKGN
jgi:hypothetical protein